jgi:predicted nucleic acid-binding protein
MNDHKWIDTNIIVRAVTGHPPHMAASLPPILNQAANGQVNLIVPSVVVAECVYVLEGLGYSRGQVAFGLRAFFGLEGVTLEEQAVILTALTDYEKTSVDFPDAYLAAKAKLSGRPVLTWNLKDFRKVGCPYEQP